MAHFENSHHLLYVFFFSLFSLNLATISTTRQGEALVKWKNSLAPSSLLDSWSLTNLDNLCNWTGITCNSAGSVFEINLSSREINGTLAEFSFISFPHLNQFNISFCSFTGPIPPHIENLTELQYLDFSKNYFNGSIPYQVCHLQRLRTFDLSINPLLYTPNWSKFSPMPLLTRLNLELSIYSSKFPEFILNCHNLNYLDLSFNMLSGDLVLGSVFNNLHNLEYLFLDYNYFDMPFPPNLFKLSRLKVLSLSDNNLSGPIPGDVTMLRNLEELRMDNNSFEGVVPSSLGFLKKLQHLDLAINHLSSSIPSELGLLTNLYYLDINSNNLSGNIPRELGLLTNLSHLYLHSNNLIGNIPPELGLVTNLDYLSLASNNLSGNVPSELWLLTNLRSLNLEFNNLTGNIPSDVGNMNLLTDLRLGSNQLTGPLPNTISNLTNLQLIDLQDNMFSGDIPSNFWVKLISLNFIDLAENNLSGNIPMDVNVSTNLVSINLSKNRFTGGVPQKICQVTSLAILDLSNNALSGALPHCLGKVQFVYLHNNQFQETIPAAIFSKSCKMELLHMSRNHFDGPLPLSLANCKKLRVLDIGYNNITGRFLSWLSPLPELEILILRSNRLYGTVTANTAHPFPKLRIVDISNNEFSGYLPMQYFNNMQPKADNYYDAESGYTKIKYYNESISLNVKGTESEIHNILHIYTAIDLSCNKFEGELTPVIGELRWLALLNLSHNSLTGHIPSLMGNMEALQALDLSSNQLTGVIPYELTSLTSLEVLNLSKNHLSGQIPQKGQFSTFNNDSYIGNSALCGLPLIKECVQKGSPPKEVEEDGEDVADSEFPWEAILLGYGIGLISGFSTGYIIFTMGMPWWFMRYIDELQQILVSISTKNTARSRRTT